MGRVLALEIPESAYLMSNGEAMERRDRVGQRIKVNMMLCSCTLKWSCGCS